MQLIILMIAQPNKNLKFLTKRKNALKNLAEKLKSIPQDMKPEDIQTPFIQ